MILCRIHPITFTKSYPTAFASALLITIVYWISSLIKFATLLYAGCDKIDVCSIDQCAYIIISPNCIEIIFFHNVRNLSKKTFIYFMSSFAYKKPRFIFRIRPCLIIWNYSFLPIIALNSGFSFL